MTKIKGRLCTVLLVVFLLLFGGFSSVSAAPTSASPTKLLSAYFSNWLESLLRWLSSVKSKTETAITGRPMMRFEGGYTVETVFDGSKHGIEPHSVEVSPSGDLLVLDSVNSNIYRMSASLSRYTRPKLVVGSAEGYTGHVDGKHREARMNHPKGFTVDDRGNIYVADTVNMAIRKITDSGVTTIAGGKKNRGAHVDGPSGDAKFSNDFEVVYVGSSCSLLVVDRGFHAIREIQLQFDDCAYQYGTVFPLGIAVLLAAGFFGYMLALLQRRILAMVSSKSERGSPTKASLGSSLYQEPLKSVRPPLIPIGDEIEKQEEEGFFASLGKLFSFAGLFVLELVGGLFGFRRHHLMLEQNAYVLQPLQANTWPVQDSYVVHNEDDPPPPEVKTTTPRKTYAFMAKDSEKIRQFKQSRAYFNDWDRELQQQQHQIHHHQQQQIHQQQQQQQQTPQQQERQQHMQHQRHYSVGPQTYYEKNPEAAGEVVFGAVQESDSKRSSVEIKAVNYGEPIYDQGMRSRHGYMDYDAY